MNVFSDKPGYRLFRRRLHFQTPEINTYHKQIVFCENKYDRITKKFLSPEANQYRSGVRHSYLPVTDKYIIDSVAASNSRKNSVDRYDRSNINHNSRWERRRSSSQVKGCGSKRQSIVSHSVRQLPFASQSPTRRCSSEGAAAAVRHNNNSRQQRRFSRRESDLAKAVASKEQNRKKTYEYQTDTTNHETGSTSGALEEINCVLNNEREHFLRALTTLAINRITTDDSAPFERNSTFTNYERNIEVLTNGFRALYVDGHNSDDENDKEGTSDASSTTTDLYGAVDNENTQHNDKRQRINQLRNYLKCSGFGDPSVITTTNEQSEDEKQAFTRLIRRINRGLSSDKQERLRRKARLEYEMSLMKGESFCEQQEQAYMRTASADMGNRDLQLLEEELRIHALREMRENNQTNPKRRDSQNLTPRQNSSSDVTRQQSNGNQKFQNGEAEKSHGGEDKPDVDVRSSSDDRDAMSGLIRNPLSKREMRKRILLWVYDVEEATGMHSQDGDKDERRRRNNRRYVRRSSTHNINEHQTKSNVQMSEQNDS